MCHYVNLSLWEWYQKPDLGHAAMRHQFTSRGVPWGFSVTLLNYGNPCVWRIGHSAACATGLAAPSNG